MEEAEALCSRIGIMIQVAAAAAAVVVGMMMAVVVTRLCGAGQAALLGLEPALEDKIRQGLRAAAQGASPPPSQCAPRLTHSSACVYVCMHTSPTLHPSLQVPIENEERAVAFVQGVVPSAVVTQRHMGALSFNAQQLQVTAAAASCCCCCLLLLVAAPARHQHTQTAAASCILLHFVHAHSSR